jgi:hypothetical protein
VRPAPRPGLGRAGNLFGELFDPGLDFGAAMLGAFCAWGRCGASRAASADQVPHLDHELAVFRDLTGIS